MLNLRKINQSPLMIGILTKNQAFIAETTSPLVMESITDYQHVPGLIPSHYISISPKYGMNLEENTHQGFFATYPNDNYYSKLNENGDKIDYSVKKSLDSSFQSGRHILQLSHRIQSIFESVENVNVYLIALADLSIVIVRKNHIDLFTKIFETLNVEETLYHLNKIFQDQSLDFEEVRVILLGEIKTKKNNYQLLQNFFRNIYVDDLNPFTDFN